MLNSMKMILCPTIMQPVSLDVELKDSFLSFVSGDEIVVYYDGNITDGKAETVYAITLQAPSGQEK